MIVVSNTSPIIGIAAVGQLELLHMLYGRVIIPQTVHDEVAAGVWKPGAGAVQTIDWIETRPVRNWLSVMTLQLELDAGESEAITLAAEMGADLLLLDEHRGRTIAARLGLRVVGSLGVLIAAKHKDLIPAIRPVMDALIQESGFWVSPAVYDLALRLAGE